MIECMANKYSRSGKKYTGSHTTLIPAAATIADKAFASSYVERISPGFIKAGLPSVAGIRRVKIRAITGGLLLTVRDNTSQQELHLYTNERSRAIADIVRGAEEEDMVVTLVEHDT